MAASRLKSHYFVGSGSPRATRSATILPGASRNPNNNDALREPARRQIEMRVSWFVPSLQGWSDMRYWLSPELLLKHSPECASDCDAATSVAAHSPNNKVALLNAKHVGEVQATYTPAKLAVVTVACIGFLSAGVS
jgi:hypothetical protein